MVPLAVSRPGETCVIQRIGGNDKTRRFLESLGFVAGSQIAVVTETGGNLIVSVKDSRLAISREMASKIMVVC